MDMPSIDDRLSALEEENQRLRAEIDRLKAPRRAIPDHQPPVEREVRVVQPAPASSFKMPTADELTKLIDAVGKRYPALLDTTSTAFEGTRHERRDQWHRNFEASFEAIGNMKRTDRPRTDLYLSYHTETAV